MNVTNSSLEVDSTANIPHFVFSAVITIISFIAIFANTAVFTLVVKKKKLKPHTYIAVLALIDFTTATLFLTLHFLKRCTAALYILGLLSRLSFVLLTVISWERYSAVRYPLHYRLSYHRFWHMMAWLLVPLVVFVALYTWGVSEDLGRTRWETSVGMCMLVQLKSGLETKIIETASLLFPMPLLAVMMYCYAYIFKEYRRHIKHPVQRAALRFEAKASMHSLSSSTQSLNNLFSLSPAPIPRVLPRSRGLSTQTRANTRAIRSTSSCSSFAPVTKRRSLSPTMACDIKLTFSREISTESRLKSPTACERRRVHSAEELDQYIGDLERRKQFSVAVSLLTVILFNFVTWLPYCVNYLSLALDFVETVKPVASAVMYSFLYCSVGFNTIIYSSRCRDIKQEVSRLAGRLRFRTRKDTVRVLITPEKNYRMVIEEVDYTSGSKSV